MEKVGNRVLTTMSDKIILGNSIFLEILNHHRIKLGKINKILKLVKENLINRV